MIVVDTSVWVEAKTRKAADAAPHLADLLMSGMARAHELVELELTIGNDSASRRVLLANYVTLPYLTPAPVSAALVFVKKHNLRSTGMGASDILILASAHAAGARIWTFDTHLAASAKALGCSYELPARR